VVVVVGLAGQEAPVIARPEPPHGDLFRSMRDALEHAERVCGWVLDDVEGAAEPVPNEVLADAYGFQKIIRKLRTRR
jgi:hypothetical protein